MSKPLFIAGIVIVSAAVAVFVFRSGGERPEKEVVPEIHKNVETEMNLNEAQVKELPPIDSESVQVVRYRDAKGIWQTALRGGPKGSDLPDVPVLAKDTQVMGLLHGKPIEEEVDQPLFLCGFDGFDGVSTSLDADPNCSGFGKPVLSDPVGYSSTLIRTGYRFAVRCRDPKDGMYVSLNARCEGVGHGYNARLGAIRAANQ